MERLLVRPPSQAPPRIHTPVTTRRRFQTTWIGAKIVRHGRYVTFQMAEVTTPRDLFADILRRIDGLSPEPAPA